MASNRTFVREAGMAIGFTTMDASAWSLQAGGSMLILIQLFDLGKIWIVGRWWGDTTLCYIPTNSKRLIEGLAVHMFQYNN